MNRFARAALLATLTVMALAPSVDAHSAAVRGFLPPGAHPDGISMKDLGTAWARWAFASPVNNPILEGRCEQSPIDSRMWYLPVSLGGDAEVNCSVPEGSLVVFTPGGAECSSLEDAPWYGGNARELRACITRQFKTLTYVEVTLDGRKHTRLHDYVLITHTHVLLPNNLLSSDSGRMRWKMYFMVVRPLSRGMHTLRSYDEFGTDFQGGMTYNIDVH